MAAGTVRIKTSTAARSPCHVGGATLWMSLLLACALNPKLALASETSDQSDTTMEDLESHNPNIVNPINKQGYGKGVPTHLQPVNRHKAPGGGDRKKNVDRRTKTIAEQTVQATLQFGVLVALAGTVRITTSFAARSPCHVGGPTLWMSLLIACTLNPKLALALDTSDQSDMTMEDLGSHDPNIVNPINKQGYGKDVPTHLQPENRPKAQGGGGKKKNIHRPTKTIAEQTVQAALQFGVLVAVALLVGMLFMISIWIEAFVDALKEKLAEMFGEPKMLDLEEQDPASLVGTFKRYK